MIFKKTAKDSFAEPSLAYHSNNETIRMDTKNITRESRAQLIGKLELIIHAIQPGTIISEEMTEVVIETLMESRNIIKNTPLRLNNL